MLQKACPHLQLHINIKQRSYNRKRDNTQNPCHLKCRIALRIDYVNDYYNSQAKHDSADCCRICLQPECSYRKDSDLHENQQEHNTGTTENNTKQSFFCCFFWFMFFHKLTTNLLFYYTFFKKYILQCITILSSFIVFL